MNLMIRPLRKILPTIQVGLITTTLIAEDVTWEGVNNSTTNASDDVSDVANWNTGSIPGAGDTAIFIYRGDDNLRGDISIDASDTNFAPDRLVFNSNSDPDGFQQISVLRIDKSLDLPGGFQVIGSGTAESSSRDSDRLRIGTQALGTVLNIDSLDITQTSPGWGFFQLGAGDANPGNSTVLNFTGSNITFGTPDDPRSSFISVNDNVAVENPTNDFAPQMRFTAVGGSVHLATAGQRTTGAIGLGFVHLDVRSDQTWTADPTAFVRMLGSAGDGGFGKYLVESIDGGRLDNLGALNMRIDGNQGTANSASTAMRLHGGTYGSLWMTSRGTSGRTQRIHATDDISFERAVVEFDVDGNSFASAYGLHLQNSDGNSDTQVLDLDGFNLEITNGAKFTDTAGAHTSGFNNDPILVLAEDSTVTVGGDILMEAPNGRGPEARATGNQATQAMGFDGGGNGMVLTLGGNFDNRVYGNGRDFFTNSTITMTGDDVVFEIADESGTSGVNSSVWGVDVFNVGTAGDPAHVALQNLHLNNNPATGDNDADKTGEQFIVNTLTVAENSMFDVSGLDVEIGAELTLDPSGQIDLNTGLLLSEGSIVTTFMGLGDQLADWSLLEELIIDSSNPGYEFAAILDNGNTFWQVSAIPEPSTYAFIFAGAAGILVWNRRRRQNA